MEKCYRSRIEKIMYDQFDRVCF